MEIVVQKFGGTSVATPEGRQHAVRHIREARERGSRVVVVVSAMGRFPDPYATDTLLQLVRQSAKPEHRDLLMACGEILASAVMADLLESQEMACETFVLDQIGIVTDEEHGDAQVLEINTASILRALEQRKVAVVPGFQGITKNRRITTLGRGGSDITAAALGAALNADVVEIYTDVDGVFSADPRVIPSTQVLSEITFQEVGEMAYRGAKVLHPRAVSFAMEQKVPLRIRSNFSSHPGTLITPHPVEFKSVVTGIAHIPKATYATVQIEGTGLDEARHRLFQTFAENAISLDLITVSGNTVSFILHQSQGGKAKKLLQSSGWGFSMKDGFAKVSVVGAGMRGKPGVMFRVVDALHRAGIPLYHSTDSHITIACLVREADMEKAVRVLHNAFIQTPSASPAKTGGDAGI